ncbi:SNF2 family domain-containing protein [Bifidobacterium saguini DSM 23967]|uniref:SNF2 helicase associated domain-containing protein n=3 Tax=Bifidobacterium TaxID=1678 RepID=A0A2N5IQR9_9BIFI|nr:MULTISPECIES: DEAD/DEAH box helicase [Bifidobacterium]KFI91965.1 SNF2 family domain-containing protein [Bifidobacterium saguini DSM 23967]PLS24306.1 Superfamily II DNA/RNA helicase [Bifidobacterium imperatoris]QSY56985.1 SNF2 helicase associated domain-containing protein [Bifidobacterium imperatoris]QTB91407.1 SNF2 helicase associated domain-containing protein [Bifidobacterium saguini]
MVSGYGVFGHVSDGFDDSNTYDDALGDEFDESARRWIQRRRNPQADNLADDDEAAVFGSGDQLTEDDIPVPYEQYANLAHNAARSVWFDDDDAGDVGSAHSAGAIGVQQHPVPIDALHRDVETSTSRAVMQRARTIANNAGSMMIGPTYSSNERIGYAQLNATMRGTTSPSSRYRVEVLFSLDNGELTGGSCTCPAYGRGYGICKHMAAIVLAFCDDPQRFDGYHAGAVRPSRAMLDYMQRLDKRQTQAKERRRTAILQRFGDTKSASRAGSASRRKAQSRSGYQGPVQTVQPGEVHLTPILSFIEGIWSVEFKIGSMANGSSYVMKAIPQFVLAMQHGEYVDYGKKLAFTHTPEMLDADSEPLYEFLSSALSVRHAAEQQDRYYGHIAIDRRLTLSEQEVASLLSLREGKGVQLVLDTWFANQPASVPVDGGDPELTMRIMRRDYRVYGSDAGYLLKGEPGIETVVSAGSQSWLLLASAQPSAFASPMMRQSQRKSAAGCRFVRCPGSLSAIRGLIGELFEPQSEGQVIAGDDMALFARTLLPELISSKLLDAQDIPRELAEMNPVECHSEFYLDRTEYGVECEIKARYGDAVVPLVPAGPTVSASGNAQTVQAKAVVGRDFDAERLAMDVVREFFDMPGAGKVSEVSTALAGSARGFKTKAARASAARSAARTRAKQSGAATIDRDNTTQIVRLFDEGLQALHEVGSVFTTPAFDRLVAPKAPSVKVGLSIKGNLVEISPMADEVPPDEVGALLASYRRRQCFHQLKDGTLVRLDGADLSTLDKLASDLDLSEKQLDSGTIELPGSQAFLLDGELPDDGSDVVKDASFTQYIDDLTVIDPASYKVPDSLQSILRPYQADGFRWLSTLCDKGFGGILADEMGLGKSVQLIALILSRYQRTAQSGITEQLKPSLIVCPASLVYNWAAEFAKFAPSFNAVVVAGSKTERRNAIARAFHADEPTVLITSYDLLRRDVEEYTADDAGSIDQGSSADGTRCCAIMALDEAQYIKNHTTKIAKAVKSVAADHRFALTGTPIENRLSELWSIFDFLMPGLLGSYKRFRERYELPIANARAADSTTVEGRAAAEVNPEAARVAHKLQALVGVFIKRRLKKQVLTDLPDKLENTLTVQLEGEQRKLYAAHEQRLRMQLEHSEEADFNTSKIRILAELTRLRQICCDPRLVYADAKDQSAKLAAIAELVETCVNEGKKALIFSQFTSFLELIAARFDQQGLRYYTITGSTPKKQRLALVDRFNADDTPAFLISLKAGNTGLNLTGASVVIHADPWWNAAAQDQATDRAHRIGQTEDVNVYQVVAKDTIEERILELQHTKSELARQFTDASLNADETGAFGAGASGSPSIASLTRDDLLDLLG